MRLYQANRTGSEYAVSTGKLVWRLRCNTCDYDGDAFMYDRVMGCIYFVAAVQTDRNYRYRSWYNQIDKAERIRL